MMSRSDADKEVYMILDWKEYTEAAIQAAADGAVLLKNDNRVLPIANDVPIALFGRVQNFYFKEISLEGRQ